MGHYYNWDVMDWRPLTREAKRMQQQQRCAYRQSLLELLNAERRNGDSVTQLYAGLLADALRTMPARHRRDAVSE